jgi:predicted molibdopterin-dependent oxidoreductase YjgC
MSSTMTRLTEPMVREHGELRTATWDEALDRANEMNFVAGKFARQVLRTNNIDSCNRT